MEVTHDQVVCKKCGVALASYRLPNDEKVLIHPKGFEELTGRPIGCEHQGKFFERPTLQIREVEISVTPK